VGKKSNLRIARIFNELQAKGKLDKPAIRTKGNRKPKIMPIKRIRVPKAICCLDKYAVLPMNFRPCIDCPKVATSVARNDNAETAQQPPPQG
jgi:hypothetical protein